MREDFQPQLLDTSDRHSITTYPVALAVSHSVWNEADFLSDFTAPLVGAAWSYAFFLQYEMDVPGPDVLQLFPASFRDKWAEDHLFTPGANSHHHGPQVMLRTPGDPHCTNPRERMDSMLTEGMEVGDAPGEFLVSPVAHGDGRCNVGFCDVPCVYESDERVQIVSACTSSHPPCTVPLCLCQALPPPVAPGPTTLFPLGLPVRQLHVPDGGTSALPLKSILVQGARRSKHLHVSWDYSIQFWFPGPDQITRSVPDRRGDEAAWPRWSQRHSRPRLANNQQPSTPNTAGPAYGTAVAPAIMPGSLPDITLDTHLPGGRSFHTCFDSVQDVRYRQRETAWTAWQCLTDCLGSTLVPDPCGRVLQFCVDGEPAPQAIAYSSQLFRTHGPVVVDMRGFNVPLSVLDVPRGASVVEALVPFFHPNFPAHFRQLLADGHWHVWLNGEAVGPGHTVDDPVDVIRIAPPITLVGDAVSGDLQPPGLLPFPDASIAGGFAVSDAVGGRWQRRLVQAAAEVNIAAEEELDLADFTVFDPVLHVRVMSASRHLTVTQLVQLAIARSQHLGDHLQGRLLHHVHPQFPGPQVVVHGPIPAGHIVVPIVFRSDAEQVCTLTFDRSWCAFELAVAATSACSTEASLRFQVARRIVSVEANYCRVPPFEARRLVDAEIITFADIVKDWTPQRSIRWQEVHRDERLTLAGRLNPVRVRRSFTHPPHTLFVHATGAALTSMPLDHLWRPGQLRAAALQHANAPAGSVVKLLPFSPHFQGLCPHVVILTPDDLHGHRRWAVVDCRRVSRSCEAFRVISIPSHLSLGLLCDLLAVLQPPLAPIGRVLIDGDHLHDERRLVPEVSLLTLLPQHHAHMHPALCFTLDILEQGLGYQSAFCRALPSRLEGQSVDTASFLEGGASTTTTTWMVPSSIDLPDSRQLQVDLPAWEGPERPDSRVNVLFLVASAQCVPGMLSVHPSIDMPEVSARLLFYVSRLSFVPGMPLVQYTPRVFRTPDNRHMVFATVRNEHEPVPYVWVDALPCTDKPVFIQIGTSASLRDIAIAIDRPRIAHMFCTVNGLPWDGTVRVFAFGDVVQVRSRLPSLISFAPDCARNILTHAAALAFPVFGPYMRFRGYTLQITPPIAYRRFTREELFTHFRGVYLNLVRDLILLPGSTAMFVGPQLPCIRVCTGVEGDVSSSQAQMLYNSFLAARFGEREVVPLRWSLGSTWLVAALPSGFSDTIWAYRCNGGVGFHAAGRCGEGLRNYPLMENTVLFPTVSFGGVGIALHTFEQEAPPPLRTFEPQVGVDELSLLQTSARVLRVKVWSEAHPDYILGIPPDATFEQVAAIASASQGRRICPFRFIPVYPPCTEGMECIECAQTHAHGSFPILVRFRHGRWPMVLRFSAVPSIWDLQQAVAMPGAVFHIGGIRWSGPQDGLVPGCCVVATRSSLLRWNPIAFRICLAASLDPDFQVPCASAAQARGLILDAANVEWPLSRCHLPLHRKCLHIAIQDAVQCPFLFQMVHCFIYTDGSASAVLGSVRAGASFNVWFGRQKPEFFAGAFSAKVLVPDMSLHDASFVAECRALQLAFSWILQLPVGQRVTLFTDCQRAGFAADGRWQCSGSDFATSSLCVSLRHLYLLLSQTRSIEVAHVRAHKGHLQNELADAMAKAAAIGCPSPDAPSCVLALIEHVALPWAWTALARISDGLPSFDFLLARRAPAPAVSTTAEASCGVVDVGLDHLESVAGIRPVSACVVSFNVQTANDGVHRDKDEAAYGGAKVKAMLEIFASRSWHIIGLQEMRLPQEAMYLTSDFICIQSASDRGHHGVALWVSRAWPRPGTLHPQHFTVLHAAPRVLLVRCCAPGIKFDCCVAHAPWRDQGDEICQRWWAQLCRILTAQSNDHYPLVLLVDANARVGEAAGVHVGDHQGQLCDVNGVGLEAILVARQLWLPSTFCDTHSGPGHTHMAVRDSSLHRNDYIGIPLQWDHSCVASRVDYDVDIGQKRCDHFPVIAEVELRLGSKPTASRQPNWQAGDSGLFCSLASSLPVLAWNTSLDAHAESLVQSLQCVQRRCFPHRARAPRKPFISDATWSLLLHRGEQRRALVSSDASVRLAMLRDYFGAWIGRRCDRAQICSTRLHRARLVVQYRTTCLELRTRLKRDRDAYLTRAAGDTFQLLQDGCSHDAFATLRIFRRRSKNVKQQARALPIVDCLDGAVARSMQARGDRWLEHFASIEAAEVVPRELIPIVATEAHREAVSWVANLDGCVPTLAQWEHSLRRSKPRKHPGPDGLRAELFRLHVPTAARATYSLVVKMALSSAEPLRFRGGLLAALYKGKGSHSDCSNSRSILLANTLSKSYHSCLRRELVPFLQDRMAPAQAGAVAGRPLEAVAMAIRAPLQLAQQLGQSAGVLFVDIRAAFYSVFRPLLLGNDLSDDYLEYALRFLHLPPIYLEWLRDLVEDSDTSACERAGVPDGLRRQLAASLQHAWSAAPHSQGLAYSWAGTRPGDPLGDVLYVLLCTQVLQDIRARIVAAGLHTPGMDPACDPCLASPTWVDDSCFFQWAPDPHSLLQKATQLCTIVHNAFGVVGLQLNNKPGKSAYLPVLRGAEARNTRVWLESFWSTGLPYPALEGPQHMPLTKSYKHLGALIDFTASLEPEIRIRLAEARQEARALAKHVLGNCGVPLKQRCYFFHSMVLSKACFSVGVWRELRVGEARTWRSGIAGLYRLLLRPDLRYEAAKWSVEYLCRQVEMPHPDTLLTLARARVYRAIQQSRDSCVRHILLLADGPQTWTAAVLRDNEWVACFHEDSASWRLGSAFSWEAHGGRLVQATTRAIQQHMQVMARTPVPTPKEPPPAIRGALQCPLCDASFGTKRQIAAHANKVHGVSSVARFYASASRICYSCNLRFATRTKLISHLSIWSKGCLQCLRESFHPLGLEQVQQLDREARALHNRIGQGRFADTARNLPIRVCEPPELEPVSGGVPRCVPVVCSEDLPGEAQDMTGARTRFVARPL